MGKTRAFLFDFDGTLVDTMMGFADIAGRVINKYHPEISFEKARERYLETSGNPFFQQLEIILPGDPTNSEKAKIFEETKIEGFFLSKFTDEVRETINKLRENGHIVGIASNNFQELIDKFVENEKLDFDIVLGFREGFEKGKPHFDFVKDKFGLDKNEMTFVGDSLKDAEKAYNYGINFVGICGTFQREDFLKIRDDIVTINSIKELLYL
ncbi:MAG TPA: HAD-IA family hydrolase [Spirochaetota bacterium]|nr:HAD-IA family hydrolase [Spirochaetota bacterium]HPJ34100.1 HAD-IA family hydrolase [Spirochaetota bacterium]